MTSVVLCHGFNVRDGGKDTTDSLRELTEACGYTVLEADYGLTGLFAVRFFSDNIASVIAGMTPEDSIGVGHSNGCNVLLQAAEQGASFDKLIFINPALDNDFNVPSQVKSVAVICNSDDGVVQMSKFIPFHRWGNAGRVGYKGEDERVETYKFKTESDNAHSAAFNTEGFDELFIEILTGDES
jgi:hypothetical protein